MGLMQVRLLSGVVVIGLVLLLVFDVIEMLTFITLIIVEAAVTMGLSLWIIRGQRAQTASGSDAPRRADQEESSRTSGM